MLRLFLVTRFIYSLMKLIAFNFFIFIMILLAIF